MNGKSIHVSSANKLSESLVATGFPIFNFNNLRAYLKILDQLIQSCHGLGFNARMGSAAVDLVYVACGRCDSFFEYNLNPWDIAAGHIDCSRSGRFSDRLPGGKMILSMADNWLLEAPFTMNS